jgi:hydrogenase small subunit
LDGKNRPIFAYRRLIHEGCERRAHFDAGRFALEFDDEGHRRGWCLYKLGCKGPETHNNCPAILFGDAGARTWPVGTGCPCFGCSEKEVAFTAPIVAQASLKFFTPTGAPSGLDPSSPSRPGGQVLSVTPPTTYPPIHPPEGHGPSAATAAVLAGLGGVALGAAAATALKLGQKDGAASDKEDKKD